MRHWSYRDVNQTIIDIVNQMGNEIVTNTRVTAISAFLLKVCESLANYPNFVVALADIALNGEAISTAKIFSMTQENLIKEKATLRSNRLAWAVVTQIMAREKQNIELAFNGFI